MTSLSDSQIIDYLSKCEDFANSLLDSAQLAQLCNGIIDVFFNYIEDIQNYKNQVKLEKQQLQDEIDMLKHQIQKQLTQIDEQHNDLYRQIDLCQQLEQQLQEIEKQSQKNCTELVKVETELRRKLHSQNSEYRNQIQTLTTMSQESDNLILQLKKEKSSIILQYDQLYQLYEEQQSIIEELNKLRLQHNLSTNAFLPPQNSDNTINIERQEHSFEIKEQKENVIYSNCPSHNQINFKWEKFQPSLSTIKSSYTLLVAPSNSKIDFKSKRKIKSLLEFNISSKQCDPYYEFFKLLTQCVKLNLGQIELFTLNLDYLFEKLKQQNIPFNNWYKYIREEMIK